MDIPDRMRIFKEERERKKAQRYSGELLLVMKSHRGIVTQVRQEIYNLPSEQLNQIEAFLKGVLKNITPRNG